jgi:hypothetical protein
LKEAQEKIATLESEQNKELEDLKARESYLKTLNKVNVFYHVKLILTMLL